LEKSNRLDFKNFRKIQIKFFMQNIDFLAL